MDTDNIKHFGNCNRIHINYKLMNNINLNCEKYDIWISYYIFFFISCR